MAKKRILSTEVLLITALTAVAALVFFPLMPAYASIAVFAALCVAVALLLPESWRIKSIPILPLNENGKNKGLLVAYTGMSVLSALLLLTNPVSITAIVLFAVCVVTTATVSVKARQYINESISSIYEKTQKWMGNEPNHAKGISISAPTDPAPKHKSSSNETVMVVSLGTQSDASVADKTINVTEGKEHHHK